MEFVKVDKDKFYKEITKRGLQITTMSKEMGFGKSALGENARKGKLTRTQTLLIERLYNIKPEDYAPDEELSGGGGGFHT